MRISHLLLLGRFLEYVQSSTSLSHGAQPNRFAGTKVQDINFTGCCITNNMTFTNTITNESTTKKNTYSAEFQISISFHGDQDPDPGSQPFPQGSGSKQVKTKKEQYQHNFLKTEYFKMTLKKRLQINKQITNKFKLYYRILTL